jgi:hypothetical protein
MNPAVPGREGYDRAGRNFYHQQAKAIIFPEVKPEHALP